MPALELLLVAVLVLINGLLSMSELAVVSARRTRLRALAERGVKGARRALALASDPGRFLSSVQIGITLIGILAGAVSGATLGARLSDWLESFGMRSALAEPIGFTFVVAVITYFSLVVGELVPKQLALKNPERIACVVAPAMTHLARIASPFVWLLDVSGRALLRLMGRSGAEQEQVTDEEIKMLVAEAESAGVLEPEERKMISGVMQLGDRPVSSVMTPRHDVDMIDLAASPAQIRKAILDSVHSRIPVHDGNADEMRGVIQVKDMLNAYLKGRKPDARNYVRKAPVIPDTMDALDVVEALKASDVHMALVHDEYGNFEGVVTSADILETISGAFRTEEGAPPEDAVERDDGSWLLSGSMAADSFAHVLAIHVPEKRGYHTLAGYALEHLGHMPVLGESFAADGWRFEIIDLDGRRIDKILAARQEKNIRTHRTA
jgi:putative hemolysin